MLTQLCAEIRNYFLAHREADIHSGDFSIENGTLQLPFLITGQYYRICGSALNDGVHKYGDADLDDEEFTGSVWAMSVPKAVLELDEEIESWVEKNAETLSSPYTSESFKGYSYTKAGGGSTGTAGYGWQDHFATRLNAWRRISVL